MKTQKFEKLAKIVTTVMASVAGCDQIHAEHATEWAILVFGQEKMMKNQTIIFSLPEGLVRELYVLPEDAARRIMCESMSTEDFEDVYYCLDMIYTYLDDPACVFIKEFYYD